MTTPATHDYYTAYNHAIRVASYARSLSDSITKRMEDLLCEVSGNSEAQHIRDVLWETMNAVDGVAFMLASLVDAPITDGGVRE